MPLGEVDPLGEVPPLEAGPLAPLAHDACLEGGHEGASSQGVASYLIVIHT